MAAPEGNKNAVGNKGGGAVAKYKPEYAAQVYEIALLGATDEDLARIFDVSETLINQWKKEHIEFSEALKKGKDEADAKVAKALFQRATGYEHPDIDIKMYEGQIIETPLVKHYPPDTTAAIFWLKNRQRSKWRDSQNIDHTTKGQAIGKVDMSQYSEDDLRTIAELQRKGGTSEA